MIGNVHVHMYSPAGGEANELITDDYSHSPVERGEHVDSTINMAFTFAFITGSGRLGMAMGWVGFAFWLNRTEPTRHLPFLNPDPTCHRFVVLYAILTPSRVGARGFDPICLSWLSEKIKVT